MSELLLSPEANAARGVGDHTCRRVLAGDAEDVRRRLVRALERLDYRLLSEQQPLLARRAARKDLIAADMLDVARTLSIGLRASGASATLATFDFTVAHGMPWEMGEGDCHTLELEADAIVALANAPETGGACAVCGAENSAEARFCRACGAPHLPGEPAELELMRLEAGSRAAHQEHVFGLFIMLTALATSLPMILLGRPGLVRVGWTFFALGMLAGTWMLLYGVRRLHRTLNPKDGARQTLAPAASPPPPALHAAGTTALPPRSAAASVTEGTTELLATPPRPEPVAVSSRARPADTDPLA